MQNPRFPASLGKSRTPGNLGPPPPGWPWLAGRPAKAAPVRGHLSLGHPASAPARPTPDVEAGCRLSLSASLTLLFVLKRRVKHFLSLCLCRKEENKS